MSMTKPAPTPKTFILKAGSRVYWLDELPNCKLRILKMETDKSCPKELYLQEEGGEKSYFDQEGCPLYSEDGGDYIAGTSPTIFPATEDTKKGFSLIFPTATFANPSMAMNRLAEHLLHRDGKVYCYVTHDSAQMESGLVHIPDNARIITGQRGLEGFVDSTGTLWEYAQPANFSSGAAATSISQYDGWRSAVTYKPQGRTLQDTSKVVQIRCVIRGDESLIVDYAGNKPPHNSDDDYTQSFAVYDHETKHWTTLDGKSTAKGELTVTHFRNLPSSPTSFELEEWV